jgi:hypothetical protein
MNGQRKFILMGSINKKKTGYFLIIFTAILALAGILSRDPIAQDVSYHLFVDTREIWSIPNFWNVVSNLPFVLVGLLGLYKLKFPDKLKVIDDTSIAYILLFFGTFLVGFGSGYYHLAPDNQTLVWDRLPMTIAFMALFSIIISEFISLRSGKALLLPLILAGILSVVYWHFSEIRGEGDLRFYALVQFYPILAIPIILVCFRSKCTHVYAYWWLLLAYIAAKLFEHFDGEVYNILGFISGHSLKHLSAALGMYVLLAFYQKRSCNLLSEL